MNESVRVTRPKTLHIVTDHKVGGVRSNLESLLDSRLALDFEFASSLIDHSNYVLRTRPVDLIVFHSACSWANVSRLFALKKHARLIIQEHHYCDSFDSLVPSQSRFFMMLRLCYSLADQV
ncbi:MAG: glycosyltransferase family 1 protein, partial [Gemmatimonadaceae bacterium]|nr:glycosyltransferase family 1 protein [Gloeobacterales cyanobacterium ES-bin-141]